MLLLLILLSMTLQTQGFQKLKVGQSIQGQIRQQKQNHSLYHIEVPALTIFSSLVIMVKTSNALADPNVYVQRIYDALLTAEVADVIACEAKGQNICVIPKDQVLYPQILYLAVVSRVSCDFWIRVDQDQELKLFRGIQYLDDFVLFKMNNTQHSQIISFDVGELHGEEYEINKML